MFCNDGADGGWFCILWKMNGDSLGKTKMDQNVLPKKVGRVLEGKVVVQLAASDCHVLVLTKEGEIYS